MRLRQPDLGRALEVPAAAVVAPPDSTTLRLSGVTLEMRRLTLVRDLDFEVAAGETVAVMGPSGAGKTTLLRAIAGLVAPVAGVVDRPAGPVAMVFQDPRLLPWRTALENVEVVLGRHDRPAARRWLHRVGLGDAADVFPGALSGGMRQRVAIARALATRSPLVLVDEPFASLDADTARLLRDDLTESLRAGGHSTVWVTHDAAEAVAVGDRTLCLHGAPQGAWTLDDPSAAGGLPIPSPQHERTSC